MVEPRCPRVLWCEVLFCIFLQVAILVYLLDQGCNLVSMFFRRVCIKLAVEPFVQQLSISFSHVGFFTHDHCGRPLVCWLDDDICAGTELGLELVVQMESDCLFFWWILLEAKHLFLRPLCTSQELGLNSLVGSKCFSS